MTQLNTTRTTTRQKNYSKSYHFLFDSLAQFYVESREMLDVAPIHAVNHDIDAHRSVRTASLVEWVVDYENCVAAVCEGNPLWEDGATQLLREAMGIGPASISRGLTHDLKQAIGHRLEKLQISPHPYFQTQRQRISR